MCAENNDYSRYNYEPPGTPIGFGMLRVKIRTPAAGDLENHSPGLAPEPLPRWLALLMVVASAISITLSLAAMIGAVKLLLWTMAL